MRDESKTKLELISELKSLRDQNRKLKNFALNKIPGHTGVQQTLRQFEERFRKVFCSSPIALCITDRSSGRIKDTNQKFQELFGYTREELIGHTSSDLNMYTSEETFSLVRKTLEEHKEIQELEATIRTKSGAMRDVITSVVAVEHDGEEELLSFALDITERNKLDGKLRVREQDFAMAQRVAKIGNWRYDVCAGTIMWSDELYRLFGFDKAHFSGKHEDFLNRVCEEDRQIVIDANLNARSHGKDFTVEYRIVLPSGEVKVMREVGRVAKDVQGRVVSLFGTCQDVTEHRGALEELKQQKELLQNIFDNLPAMLSVADKRGKILFVNKEWELKLGWTLKELEEQHRDIFVECYPDPGYRQSVLNFVRESDGGWEDFKMCVRDGRIIDTTWARFELSDGTSLGIGIDITQRKRTEEELLSREQEMKAIFEILPVGISIMDREYKVLEMNSALASIIGMPKGKIFQGEASSRKFIRGDSSPKPNEEFPSTVAIKEQRTVLNSEIGIVKENGQIVWTNVSAAPLQGERVVVVTSDITERIHTEKAVIASEKKYRDLVDTATVGVFQSAPDGQIIFANDGFLRMIGYESLHELSALNFQKLHRNAGDHKRFVDALCAEGKSDGFETELLMKDGSVKTIIMSATLDDRLVSGVCVDITERKKAEVALHTTQRSLRRLSHRLLEIQENERRQIARELHDEIGQILTATKIDLEVIRRNPLPVDLINRLNDDVLMLDACLREVRNLSLDLRPSILDDLGLLAALRWQLERFQTKVGFEGRLIADGVSERFNPDLETICFRIAQEALTNIAKHSRASHVEIEMQRNGISLAMSIRDDGIGFDIDRAMTDAIQSKSFGILGMQERVSLFGGVLEFKSIRGKGTSVEVRLPVGMAQSDSPTK
ncbi:MAG TPA: PAS domain S-box protein [Bacteroidota bacterium]|nr:PAS domain S-box protein [Bacteroidota bacterium]